MRGLLGCLHKSQDDCDLTECIVLPPRLIVSPVFACLLAHGDASLLLAIQKLTGSGGRQRITADSVSSSQIATSEGGGKAFQHFSKLAARMFERVTVSMAQWFTVAMLPKALLPKALLPKALLPKALLPKAVSGVRQVRGAERIVMRVV